MPPVSVCHQLSWIGRPSAPLAPDHGLRVERLADAGDEPQRRQVVRPRAARGPCRISIRIAVGAVYQTVTCWSGRIPYQRAASKSASSMTHRDAVSQRRDDAVRRAGHPARVGRAPEDVVRLQVQRERGRSTWCATTASCTCIAPFGLPVVPLVKCSSAMSRDRSAGSRSRSRPRPALREARSSSASGGSPDDQDVLQPGQRVPDRRDLAPVERGW